MCLEENVFVMATHLQSHHLKHLLTCHCHIKTEAVAQQPQYMTGATGRDLLTGFLTDVGQAASLFGPHAG